MPFTRRFICLLLLSTLPVQIMPYAKWFDYMLMGLHKVEKTLKIPNLNLLDGYASAANITPPLEVLYAWSAYDQFEAYGALWNFDNGMGYNAGAGAGAAIAGAATLGLGAAIAALAGLKKKHNPRFLNNSQPITESVGISSYNDVTPTLKNSLKVGGPGIYVPRIRPVVSSISHHGPGMVQDVYKNTDDLKIESMLRLGAAPTKGRGTYFQWQPDFSDKTIGKTISVTTDRAPLKTNNIDLCRAQTTTGIVYRDAEGIHFRRFENWQNITLPAVASITMSFDFSPDKICGAYIHNHQLEEVGRGLVTATVKGPAPLHFLATDRMGWANTFYQAAGPVQRGKKTLQADEVFCPGVYVPLGCIGPDLRLLSSCPEVAKGVFTELPESFRGKDPFFGQPSSLDLFRFQWGTKGSVLSQKTRFAQFPNTRDYDAAKSYIRSVPEYKYYDESNHFQSLKLKNNLDPAINPGGQSALMYPGSATTPTAVWFALDQDATGCSFKAGIGSPRSEADIDNDTAPKEFQGKTLYARSGIVNSPYLRNFGFACSPGSNMIISNIKSRYLNPAKKFCTPAYLKGKFLFWRKEWVIAEPNAFAITFSARGSSVQVAIGAKSYADRMSGASFDTSYNYAIRANTAGVTIEKMRRSETGAGTVTPLTVTKGQAFPAAADPGTYYDYWITFANGTIQFGQGGPSALGTNVIATATDITPCKDNVSYCFSGDIRTTDYINIAASSHSQKVSFASVPAAALGAYTLWSSTNIFPTIGRGGIKLRYADTTTDATKANLQVGLRAGGVPLTGSTAVVPDYAIIFGDTQNSATSLLHRNLIIDTKAATPAADGSTASVLSCDGSDHALWIMFNQGTILTGAGADLGYNVFNYMADPTVTSAPINNPATKVNAFCLSSISPTMTITIDDIVDLPLPTRYIAKPDATAEWNPLWQWNTGNSGTLTFTMNTLDGIAQVNLFGAATPLNAPIYTIVINDNGNAYIVKNRMQQKTSIARLTPEQKPVAAGTKYWITINNDTISVGCGANPQDVSSALINGWKDSAPASPPIMRFTLGASNKQVGFNAISWQPAVTAS